VIYRSYTPQDFDPLYAIEELCFEPHSRFGRSYMRQLVSRSNAATWIAEEDGRLTGFAILEWAEGKSGIKAYIQTIEVAPEARGRGVGRKLLGCIESSAYNAGAALIWLHVEAANAAAIRLYETHGYRCEGRKENYYPLGRAALIYMKRLNSAPNSPISVK
jgi:ribosomal-protein-alanine N-acetyltransferase